jgi:ribulose-phosphate 3-epimerase
VSGPQPVLIAPSILTADFGRLADDVAAAEAGGADVMHIDVMDGHFVPQLSFGPLVVEAVRRATNLPVEAHMMVTNPLEQLAPLAEAGAGRLIFHLEAAPEPQQALARTRELGCETGIAISPQTAAASLDPWLAELDLVTVMLVHPGLGGQELLVEQLEKVRELRRRADAAGLALPIEVDGGVKVHNAASCVEAGATLLVAGSAVYNERETPAEAIAGLRAALATAASASP